MEYSSPLNILFIINPASGGKNSIDWEPEIRNYFNQLSYHIEILILTGKDDADAISSQIKKLSPQKVVAVGGDGTICLVAGKLLNTSITMGILPGGSANGMAEELNIPKDINAALDLIINGKEQKCDVLKINGSQICIHLSDLGLNARLIKYFDKSNIRGMWGYVRMLFKILIEGKPVNAHIAADGLDKNIPAYMIVIANATKYGTGAVINPEGSVNDGIFELVVVRKISMIEFLKLFLRKVPFNPKKVEIFKTTKAVITVKRKTHFQVDGEYMGKINKVTVEIIPAALNMMVTK
ncbi:MAG TPA: diacylglycerol kinase family protein [Hanamia sp.]